MRLKHNSLNFRGQEIYVGIDVHLKSWSVSIYTKEIEHKTFTMPPEASVLERYLKRYFPGASYKAAYEAGFSGFWLEQQLRARGIDCIVVNAADVPQRDKDKRNKTDKVDSRRLAKGLRDGQVEGIYVPSRQQQEERTLLRTRDMLVRDQTRCKNRIKSMLYYYGIIITESRVQSYWSKNYIKKLEEMDSLSEPAKTALILLIEELKVLKMLIGTMNLEIRRLSQSPRYSQSVELLRTVPGIGLLSAMTILTELMDIRRFRKYDQLNAYAGLMPMEHSSGERILKTDITVRRNRMLRHVLIESAWTAVGKDPALMQAYRSYIARGIKKNKAVVKIARKLLSRTAHVLINKEPYSIAVVQ
jgi:transposase